MTACEVLRTTLLLSPLSRDSLLSLVRELVRNNMILLLPQQGMLCLALDDPDLKSSLEGGGPRSGGGCWPLKIDSEKRDRRQNTASLCFCFLAFHSAQRAAYFESGSSGCKHPPRSNWDCRSRAYIQVHLLMMTILEVRSEMIELQRR